MVLGSHMPVKWEIGIPTRGVEGAKLWSRDHTLYLDRIAMRKQIRGSRQHTE